MAILLTGCSTAVQDLAPETIIKNSTTKMRGLAGFSFKLTRSGAPVYVDPTGIVTFREASGAFVAPDRVQGIVKVIVPGIVAEVSIIGIGELEWETNIFSGEWMLVPPEYAFKPAVLFEPEGGIQQAIEKYLVNVEVMDVAELEEVPGLSLYHLRGQMDGANVHDITFGLIDNQLLNIELWIAPGSFEVHRALIIDPANEGAEEGTTWQLDFWDFGKVIVIEAPI